MGLGPIATVALTLALCCFDSAMAQPASAGDPKTLKERMAGKAADEQRVDNCRVPADKRGSRPRPDCASEQPVAR